MNDAAAASPRARASRRLQRWRVVAARLDAAGRRLAMLRFVLALAAIALAVVAIRSEAWRDRAGWSALVAAGLFVAAVAWHRRVRRRASLGSGIARAIEREIVRLDGAWRELPRDGATFAGAPLAEDLALFGPGSLFQMISRCATPFGEARLAACLIAGRAPAHHAEQQAAVAELAPRAGRRQRLEAVAAGALADPAAHQVLPLLQGRSLHDGRPWLAPLAGAAAALTVGQVLAALAFDLPTLAWPCIAAQAVVAAVLARRLQAEYEPLLAHESALEAWSQALSEAERLRGRAPRLVALHAALAGDETAGRPGAGKALRELSSTLEWLALRHSSAYWPLNALLLWDVLATARLAAWRRAHAGRVTGWLDALSELEALSSLAGHAATFERPVFAEIDEAGPAWEGLAVEHPLLPRERVVANDLTLPAEGSLMLLTGSNMAGKSTMLRAVGLNTVLALAGGPVHARRLRLRPCALMTSIRVTDALDEGVSSFYAEVRRLKAMLDALEASGAGRAPALLFLVDEILRGTNTRERLVAARAVVTRLAAGRAFGIVTSHDLALTELEGAVPGLINAHFRETIESGRMGFDYRLRPGPVPTTNALAILRLEGIDVPEA